MFVKVGVEYAGLFFGHFCQNVKNTCFQAASFAPGLARALVAAVNFKNQMRHEQKKSQTHKKRNKNEAFAYLCVTLLFSGTSSAPWKMSRGGFEEERRGMEIMIGGGAGR